MVIVPLDVLLSLRTCLCCKGFSYFCVHCNVVYSEHSISEVYFLFKLNKIT